MRHFLTLDDLSKEEILEILTLSKKIKSECKSGENRPYLKDRSLAMIFEKNSTRTRVSFEVGIHQLGGFGLFLSSKELQLGRGEPIKDTSRVISRMCDMAMLRVYKHSDLVEFASYSQIPVINGLSDLFHPVQLMADLLTISEYGMEKGAVAYVGDGNNMANSWLMAASKLGFELRVATPEGYEPDKKIVEKALINAKKSGAKLIFTNSPEEAVNGTLVVATDTWISMGQEEEKESKMEAFDGFCVDRKLMSLAKKEAIFLHCLPAYRGYEVSDGIFERYSKVLFDEAENRLHAQKGIMVWLEKMR